MLSASSRARSTPMRSSSRAQLLAARDHLQDVRFDAPPAVFSARSRSSSPASSARSGRALRRRRAHAPATFVFAARDLPELFPDRSVPVPSRPPAWLCSRCCAGAFVFPRQPFQFQPRHRQTRAGAGEFLRQLALLMIQRQRVLFLMSAAAARRLLQLLGQLRRFPLQLFQLAGERRRLPARVLPPATLSSRNSRFSARGPPLVLRPPLTAWP